MAGAPDPKQGASIRDPEAGKEKCELEGKCRLCRRDPKPRWKGGRPTDSLERHHLVPKGMGRTIGGDDLDENIVPLCTRCHRMVTDRVRWALNALRLALLPAEIDYIKRKKGKAWLTKTYPPS